MAAQRRKIVAEDLNIGASTVTIPTDSGGTRAATQVGIQTFVGGVMNAADQPGLDIGEQINACVAVLTSGGTILIPNGTYQFTTPIVLGSSIVLQGQSKGGTVLDYTPTSGIAITASSLECPALKSFTLKSSTASGTTTGVKILNTNHANLTDMVVQDMATNLTITGSGGSHSFDTRVLNSQFLNCRTTGINIDHAVDTYLTNILNWGVTANPTTAWSIVIDTAASGVYMSGVSCEFAGVKIQNSMPSSAGSDEPPEFVFAHKLLSDTVTGTDAILFDSTLSVVDAGSRKGKSYHFVDCWACFTQTSGKCGVNIAGGEDITLTDFRARVNQLHGIHISDNGSVGPNNIRIINASLLGNNQQGDTTGAGLYIDGASRIIQVDVISGRAGNVAGEGPTSQNYGIYLAAGASDQITILGMNVSTNTTAGISDNSTGANKNIMAVADYAAGVLKDHKLLSDKARITLGDGNYYLDFKNVDANSVIYSRDSGDYEQYDRNANTLDELIGSTIIMRTEAGGVGIFGGTDASAALTITSTTKGVLLPRMTSTQRDAISSPADGLFIYNTTTGKLNFVQGGSWHEVTST